MSWVAQAEETTAKVELIEELSDNLYSRWQDLVASGVPEEEAYARALEDLGNVDELLASRLLLILGRRLPAALRIPGRRLLTALLVHLDADSALDAVGVLLPDPLRHIADNDAGLIHRVPGLADGLPDHVLQPPQQLVGELPAAPIPAAPPAAGSPAPPCPPRR